jgi:hypothetical protein
MKIIRLSYFPKAIVFFMKILGLIRIFAWIGWLTMTKLIQATYIIFLSFCLWFLLRWCLNVILLIISLGDIYLMLDVCLNATLLYYIPENFSFWLSGSWNIGAATILHLYSFKFVHIVILHINRLINNFY